ncbi:G2/M phase-specific E3 ubiquitin-protein ligase-like isoform X2 [Takifugu rubripes]|uniref:G2/M phase-specific E3 ubiquitin-protein ligase-like isoform X2 n=1 Tax=Takifugu rubripes TaxID=31033 RepID=UPI0011458C0A|nr:G2/M phase-specific E3 ubiquitin-protein ligase-like isoform X2 [Takifugu rubripes]
MDETEETSTTEWTRVPDPKCAGRLFSQELLHRGKDSGSLSLSLDLRHSRGEQDRAIASLYRRDGLQWSSPLNCALKGDVATGSGVDRHIISTVISRLMSGLHLNLGGVAVTRIFEGESDHLIPSVSEELLENNMFAMAGRMIGHSFLHNGPSFPGLSPAIVHVLFGGSLETAPVTIRDCPDLDIREIVEKLEGDAEFKEDDSIHQLCLSWDFPAPSNSNRKWLAKKLLLHAVIEQTRRQINHFRRGLEDTGIWTLLSHRRDVIPVLFPRESEAQVTPQMILDCITWPSSITVIFDKYEDKYLGSDEFCTIDIKRVSSFLKMFIENGSLSS